MDKEELELQKRREALLERRIKLIDAGQLQPCEPLENERKPGVLLPDPSICPSCGNVMPWKPKRNAFICEICQKQPANP